MSIASWFSSSLGVCSPRMCSQLFLCLRRGFICRVWSTCPLKIHHSASECSLMMAQNHSRVSQSLIRRNVDLFISTPLDAGEFWISSPSQQNTALSSTRNNNKTIYNPPNIVAALEKECRGTQTLQWGDPKKLEPTLLIPGAVQVWDHLGTGCCSIKESPEFPADKSFEIALLEQEIVLLLPQFSLTNYFV